MKRALAVTVFLLTSYSLSALAIQPYHDESCQLASKAGRKLQFYASSAQTSIVVSEKDEAFELEAQYVRRDKKLPSDSDLTVRVVKETAKGKNKYNDGCLMGETGKLIREVTVAQASNRAMDLLGLKAGQKLTLNCQWENLSVSIDCRLEAVR